ncbi:hypothetical protein B6N13_02085 [Marinomonas sp. UCMA 3892]|uniref:polysaccharide biosynthesis C-terminal domain-containing protein n=1 Tax=Marinomonas sp. UCMA 3892 TaxID=1972585 RepID=UPI00146AC69C|nr:polysaccharide biosynthesis C-terminal domain-containing protein [Marinomonas sp. UCMA 3892]NLU96887.1 hypothetical protein [Marinomonas sp. UCMA 3892]
MRKKIIMYGLSEGVSKGLNVLLILLLPLFLSVSDFSKVVLYIGFEQVIFSLILFGQNTSFIKWYDASEPLYSSTVLKSTNSIFLFTSVVLLSLLFCYLLYYEDYWLILFVFSGFFMARNEVQNIKFRVDGRHYEYFKAKNILYIAKFLLCLCFILIFEFGAEAYIISMFLSAVLIHFLYNNDRFFKSIVDFDKKQSASIALYSLPIAIQAAINIVFSYVDRFMVSKMLPEDELAVYGFSYNIGALGFFFVSLYSVVLLPNYYKEKSLNDKAKNILKSFFSLSIASIFLYMFVIFIFYFYFSRFYPSEYKAGLVSSLIVCTSYFFHVVYLVNFYKLNIIGELRYIPFVSFFSLLISVFLSYFFIPVFGINGAAFSLFISQFALAYLAYVVFKRVEFKYES